MAKAVSPLKVGSFVLAVLFLALGMLLFFSTTTLFTRTESYVVYFEDSVKGLSVGSSVKFKGVPIGQVKKIYISYNQPANTARVPVMIEVEAEQLRQLANMHGVPIDKVIEAEVQKGLRAQLQLESFITGILFVELNYFPGSGAPVYVQNQPLHKEIPTVKGPFSDLGLSANDLMARLAAVDYQGLADETKRLAATVNDALQRLDMERLGKSINTSMEALSGILSRADEKDFGGNLGEGAKELREAAGNFSALAKELDRALKGESQTGVELNRLLRELGDASENFARLADYLERHPNAILTGKKDE